MAEKNIATFGIYPTYANLENAVQFFRTQGFRETDISVLMPENIGSKDLATTKSTKAPEGATVGAASGAVIGGALAWFTAVGLLTIPGAGPFLAAGPIMAAFAGAGAAGVTGGIAGALIGMGIPEYEARRYEGRIRSGGILLSVHCDDHDWAKRAKEILERTGARDISTTREADADYAKTDRPLPREDTGGAV